MCCCESQTQTNTLTNDEKNKGQDPDPIATEIHLQLGSRYDIDVTELSDTQKDAKVEDKKNQNNIFNCLKDIPIKTNCNSLKLFQNPFNLNEIFLIDSNISRYNPIPQNTYSTKALSNNFIYYIDTNQYKRIKNHRINSSYEKLINEYFNYDSYKMNKEVRSFLS